MNDDPRQRIERVGRGRRVRLTPVPGTSEEPTASDEDHDATPAEPGQGPNDERMRRDVPPHW